MRSGNPTLRDNVFSQLSNAGAYNAMTVQGTVNKSFLMALLVVFSASLVWNRPSAAAGLLLPSLAVGFIIALVTVFKKEYAPYTAPIYALTQGVVLGAVSAFFEKSYPGIVIQAVGLTISTLICMLIAYKTGIINPTQRFRLGIIAATGGIALFYLTGLIMSFFGFNMGIIHSSTPIGIAFSAVVVIVAALNLVIDFDFIVKGAAYNAPGYMEWYGAFALMVTLIWLYLEILRLLSKTRNRW
ncbi:MAG: Bax inhibitor-1/YccA family protein [Candidatus Omnitrophota bacterium]